MTIAVLMSTFNGHLYIDEQLKSIASQTLKNNIVLYVRDDGSTDDTIKIIERWKKKLNIIIYKGKNIGPAKSFWELFMNLDIQADYYAFCDQDDIWDIDKIERGVNSLKGHDNEAMLWCSNCRLIDGNDVVLEKQMYKESLQFSIVSQIVSGTIQGCAMLFNNCLRNYIYNKQITDFPMHDFVLITYAIAAGRVIYDETPAFSYRIHANNVVANRGKNRIQRTLGSINKWFSKEHIYENSSFAKQIFLDNEEYLDQETKSYINMVTHCKKNFINRIKIIKNPLSKTIYKDAERSYKIRVFLGII